MKKIFLVLACSFLLFGCGTKKSTQQTKKTPVIRTFELKESEKPSISLDIRSDGHEITLKIDKIASIIKNIEYELTYKALENSMEIEKGLGDTIKVSGTSLERKLLLGTESCTNGCKYKYDEGITGGNLNLLLINQEGQAAQIQKTFTLTQDKKTKKFVITLNDVVSSTSPDQ